MTTYIISRTYREFSDYAGKNTHLQDMVFVEHNTMPVYFKRGKDAGVFIGKWRERTDILSLIRWLYDRHIIDGAKYDTLIDLVADYMQTTPDKIFA